MRVVTVARAWYWMLVCLSLTAASLSGCHKSSSTPNVGVVTGGTTLAIALSTATGSTVVLAGSQMVVTATIVNDAQNKGVTWTLTGPGSLLNATTTSVTYQAPNSVIGAEFATITATSIADTTQSTAVTLTTNGTPTIPQPVLFPGNQNTNYVSYINVVGGAAPYVWTISAGKLPDGLSISNTGSSTTAIVGKPSTIGSSSFTVQVTDTDGLVATANLSLQINNQASCLLNGQYVYQLNGFVGEKTAVRAGTFSVDSAGNVTGQFDLKSSAAALASQAVNTQNLCQTYTQNFGVLPMGSTFANESFNYAVGQTLASGHMQQNDGTGQLMAGPFTQQDTTSFNLNALAGDWVFGLVGDDGQLNRLAYAGRLSLNAGGVISAGQFDSTAGSGFSPSVVNGTFAAPDTKYGRGTVTLSLGSQNFPLSYYVVDANHVWLVSNDTSTSTPRVSGQLTRQTGAGLLDATVFKMPSVMSLWGMRYAQSAPVATVGLLQLLQTSPGVVTVQSDVASEGAYDSYNLTTGQPVTMTTTGRGTLGLTIGTVSHRFVLYSDGAGGGFVVEPQSVTNNYGILRAQTILTLQNPITSFLTTYYLGGTMNPVATSPITNLAQLLIGQGSISGGITGYYVLDPPTGRMTFSASRLILGGSDVVGYVLDQKHVVLMGDSLSIQNSQIAWLEAY